MTVLPVGWRHTQKSLNDDAATHVKKQLLDSRLCSICMMCCLIMGKMIFPPRPQAILSSALSPATALLDKRDEHTCNINAHRAKESIVGDGRGVGADLSKSSSSSSSAMAHSSSSSRSTIMASIWGTGNDKDTLFCSVLNRCGKRCREMSGSVNSHHTEPQWRCASSAWLLQSPTGWWWPPEPTASACLLGWCRHTAKEASRPLLSWPHTIQPNQSKYSWR